MFLADNCAPGEFVNTPRSLQACLYLGIDPQEIENKYVFFTALCIYLSNIYASKSFSVVWHFVVLAVQIDVVCTYSSFAKHFAFHWQHSHWQQNTAIHMSCRGRDYFVERGLRLELQEMKFQYYEKERKGMWWMSTSFIMCYFFDLDLAFAEDLDTHLKSVCNVDVKFWGCRTDSLAY